MNRKRHLCGQNKLSTGLQDSGNSKPDRMHEEVEKDPLKYPDNKTVEPATYELKEDPAGDTPAIKQARVAAPKPAPDADVSMDDKSRELDDALVNHDVQGQKVDIDEGSLAFPVSGEKSFDEAGETKRQAQAEIAKTAPRYRQQEQGVITKSQHDIDGLVNIKGLMGHHESRSKGFKGPR